ncbi:acyltransferase family protein [Paractinoplanes toevensis]|uniref:Acyltransferase n=1 Tax=Paractinoplanes toevensis TaxID=571911 RepID=A0A919W2J1_9ACTN|nr:acyltransferase family protein [Actinoplanes toevensis]GIM89570.1 acyltransferase [Actinoplanes toevensis]
MSGPVRDRAVRFDIQALRAFAVATVVCAHLWPRGWLPGGFVGVDVFFVISGFLITSHLMEHVRPDFRGLLDFWGRRVRRLLPASLAVLAVTAVAGWVWLPESQWAQTARQIRAAATYWINWQLAGDSVDYFAAGTPESPVQHYWSLAVEEQFYLVWPLFLLALTWLGWRLRDRRKLYFTGLLVVAGASLWWSIRYTDTTPSAAYFVSTTRIWELGAGSLLAVVYPALVRARSRSRTRGKRIRIATAYAGWLLMGFAVLRFSADTPIPGWHALVPVAGATMVIATNAHLVWYPARVLQWLGDHSYSIYLWHWPLLLIEPAVFDNTSRGWADNAGIVLATLGLAALTKRYLEDPVRMLAWWRPLVRTYALGAAGMVIVIALAATWSGAENRRQDVYQRHLTEAVARGDRCFGAGALDPGLDCGRSLQGPYYPQTSTWQVGAIYADQPGLDGQKCNSVGDQWPVVRCDAGELSSPTTVVLAGNSHAFQWLEAVSNIAEAERWHLVTYYATGCPLTDIPRTVFQPATVHCADWQQGVLNSIIELKPAMMVTSNLSYENRYANWFTVDMGRQQLADAYTVTYQRLRDAGIRTVVINDTPSPSGGNKLELPQYPNADPIGCLNDNRENYEACSAPRSDWEYHDPALDAVSRIGSPKITSVDLNNHICGPEVCDAVVGGVRVRQDDSHLTATYVHTLIPYLRPALMAAIAGP